MGTNLNSIKIRFPSKTDLIDYLYRSDRSFNSLCDDYILVVKQIREFSGSTESIPSADIGELKNLLNDLEDEMTIYFEDASKTQ